MKNLEFELIHTDGRLSREDFIRSISTGSVNLSNKEFSFIIKNNILNYFDEVVVVVVIVEGVAKRFCFVNSSIDEAELLSVNTEGTGKSLILNVEVVL